MTVGTGSDGDPGPVADWVVPESGVEVPLARPPEHEPRARVDAGESLVEPPVPLRPMTYADILDGSFRVIKRRPKAVITVAAVIVVPVQFLAAYAQRSSLSTFANLFSGLDLTGLGKADSGWDLLLLLVANLLSWLMLFFLGGALGRLVTSWYAGGDLSAGEALSSAFARTGALVAAWLLLLPVKAIATLPCYLGLVFVVPLFALTAPVIVVEGIGPIAGAKRSWQLVSRRLWPSIGIILLVTLVQTVLRQVLIIIPTIVAAILPDPFNWIVLGAASSLVSLVTASALVAGAVLLYVDLRVRTEGLDLEMRATDAFAPA